MSERENVHLPDVLVRLRERARWSSTSPGLRNLLLDAVEEIERLRGWCEAMGRVNGDLCRELLRVRDEDDVGRGRDEVVSGTGGSHSGEAQRHE